MCWWRRTLGWKENVRRGMMATIYSGQIIHQVRINSERHKEMMMVIEKKLTELGADPKINRVFTRNRIEISFKVKGIPDNLPTDGKTIREFQNSASSPASLYSFQTIRGHLCLRSSKNSARSCRICLAGSQQPPGARKNPRRQYGFIPSSFPRDLATVLIQKSLSRSGGILCWFWMIMVAVSASIPETFQKFLDVPLFPSPLSKMKRSSSTYTKQGR